MHWNGRTCKMTPDKFTWSAVLDGRRLRRVPGSARLCGRSHVSGPTQVCPTVGVCSRCCWWRIAVRTSSASVSLACTRNSHILPGLSGRTTVGRIAGGYPLPGLPANASGRDQPIQFAKARGARRRSLRNCRGPRAFTRLGPETHSVGNDGKLNSLLTIWNF